jgi:hypothetical protein
MRWSARTLRPRPTPTSLQEKQCDSEAVQSRLLQDTGQTSPSVLSSLFGLALLSSWPLDGQRHYSPAITMISNHLQPVSHQSSARLPPYGYPFQAPCVCAYRHEGHDETEAVHDLRRKPYLFHPALISSLFFITNEFLSNTPYLPLQSRRMTYQSGSPRSQHIIDAALQRLGSN